MMRGPTKTITLIVDVEHRAAGEDEGKVPRIGHVGPAHHIDHGVAVFFENVGKEKCLDIVCLKQAEHGVVLGYEGATIHRPIEVKLRVRLVVDHGELTARPMHDHSFKNSVSVRHKGLDQFTILLNGSGPAYIPLFSRSFL
jgi:hypothetical protein